MISEVLDGITEALHSAFPESEVYPDKGMSDIIPGSFSIVMLPFTPERLIGDRWNVRTQWCIYYFPKEEYAIQTELAEMQWNLTQVLEMIPYEDGVTRGTNMNGEVSDDVLAFTVNYNFTIIAKNEAVLMETLTQHQKARK